MKWVALALLFAVGCSEGIAQVDGQRVRICDKADATKCVSVDATGALSTAGGAAATSTAINDGTITTQKASVSAAGELKVDNTGKTQPISAASLPLPTGAAQEHTTAASPHSARLTDGATFYDARSIRALTATDVVTAAQGTAAASTAGWPTTVGTVAAGAATWTSATAVNTTLSIAVTGYSIAAFTSRTDAGTFTAGAITFEASDDSGTNWYTVSVSRQSSPASESTVTLATSTSRLWQYGVGGLTNFRVRLSTAITGTGTANLRLQASAAAPETNVGIYEPTFGALRVSGRPMEVLGVYHVSSRTATYAGVAAGGPLVALRNPSAAVLIIPLRFKIMVVTTVAATTAGLTQRELIIGRSWTVSDTGTAITLTGNNNKLRTSFSTSIADLKHGAPMTAGTRTLDANAMGTAISWTPLVFLGTTIGGYGASGSSAVNVAGATWSIGAQGVDLIDRRPTDEYPIVLAQNEGLLLRLGPDAEPTGATQQTYFDITWAEATAY